MTSSEQQKQQLSQEQRLMARLQWATSRMEAAEQERIWAIVTAHSSGLSIRKIAVAAGLSSSRVHQLLHRHVTKSIAQTVEALCATGEIIDEPSPHLATPDMQTMQQQLSEAGEILRWCIDWLEQLAGGEHVIANSHSPSDPGITLMPFDQTRVIQVLKQIAGNLDKLSGQRITDKPLASGVDRIAAEMNLRDPLIESER